MRTGIAYFDANQQIAGLAEKVVKLGRSHGVREAKFDVT
jgi:hypothetical protein